MNEEEKPVRHFSAEEANALLPTVGPLVEQLRDAHALMEARQDEVTESIPTNGGGAVHREFLEATTRAGKAMGELEGLGLVVRDPSSGLVDFPAVGELEGLGLVVRDPSSGLVDFPAVRDGQNVFLCWRLGEPAVEWFHPPEAGFAGRQPL
jgi:hypothetical protein